MFSKTYLALAKRLRTNIPALKEVAWYQEQGETVNEGQVTTSPGAYIRFEPVETKDLQQGIQWAFAEFDIIVLSINTHEDDKRAGQDDAVDHFLILDEVYKAMIGFSPRLSFIQVVDPGENDFVLFNSVTRTEIEPEHELRSMMKTTITFKTMIKDLTAATVYTPIVPDGQTLEIEDLDIDC